MAKWTIEEQKGVFYFKHPFVKLIFHIQIKIVFHGIVTQNSAH